MAERRKARRYELYLPVQVCLSVQRPVEFHTGQLRDVSRSFSLPAEKERGTTVLVRASAKALRVSTLHGEDAPLYGVAATIDRIDFIRPVISSAA
jgi:hypothetical protein